MIPGAVVPLVLLCLAAAPNLRSVVSAEDFDGASPKLEEVAAKIAPPRCRLYLAPTSSSSSSSGWGVFTSVPLSEGEALSLPDIVINVPDIELNWKLRMTQLKGTQWHDEHAGKSSPFDPVEGSLGPALRHHARPSHGLIGARYDAEHVSSIAPGVASIAQRRKRWGSSSGGKGSISNVRGTARPLSDGAGLRRSRDPGVGAYTEYHSYDHSVVAKGGLSAGSELFVDDWGGGYATNAPNVIHRDDERRSPQWLEQHGLCLDNLRPGRSSIPQAGRGAFATRHVARGDVISPVPVAPVRRDGLGRRFQHYVDNPIVDAGDFLLRNYLLGHPDSSVMLLPLGATVNLINHASRGEANAELNWSVAGGGAWLDRPAEEVFQWDDPSSDPFPMMELVALRDIEPDEEVLLNYGPVWEKAWSDHLLRWKERGPILHGDLYVHPNVLNADATSDIRTEDETEDEPYPSNLMLMCRVASDIGERVSFDGRFGPERKWVDLAVSRGDETFWTHDSALKPCSVIARKSGRRDDPSGGGRGGVYTVMVDFSTFSEDGPGYVVYGVPRRAIEFVDRAYAKDQFLSRAFRHEIGLRDGVFPPSWMDLRIGREEKNSGRDKCGLFMAPSSIPNSGLGMYTAREIPLGTSIFYPDIVVHQYEHDGNNELRRMLYGLREKAEKAWLLYTYFWESRCSHGMFETDVGSQTIAMIPGLGMLANSHTGLVNAMMRRPDVDSAGLHRSRDPGAGAFSEFHNYRYEAVSLHPDHTKHGPIPAGMELFVEYGDEWFAEREELFGPIPLSTDFAQADRILDRFVGLVDAINRTGAFEDLWNITHNMVKWSPRMELAMPRKLEDVRPYHAAGAALSSVPDAIRSIEWLEQNGRCLDNIRPGRSTIRQAGRGAFATRLIGKGTVIAPAPVAHIDRKHLGIYERDQYENMYFHSNQLLLNYCYGHPDSSLLLFPYAPVVNFINHAPKGTEPNALVRWSTLTAHHADWLDRTVEELMSEDHAGLIMEFVALRDVAEGEEIFIDYGEGWTRAWERHVQAWKPIENAEDYVSASVLNARGGPIRTEAEQEEDPYPQNVMTICYVPTDIVKSVQYGPHNWYPESRLLDYADFGHICTILEREDADNVFSDSCRPIHNLYTARVQHWEYEKKSLLVRGIPGSAVELVDKPYSRDQFLQKAFRQEIHVPKSMFPRKWMNLIEWNNRKRDSNSHDPGEL